MVQLHAQLRKRDETFTAAGGHEALRWARRIIRQDGMLKASVFGDLELPELVDLQYGPDISLTVLSKSAPEVASDLEAAGLSGCVVPGNGTLLIRSVDALQKDDWLEVEEDRYAVTHADLDVSEVDFSKSIFVEENRNRLAILAKSARGSASFRAYEVEGADFDYFLHAEDRESFQILKVDDALGIVLGWGIICKVDGKDYFDLQGEHIPEDVMLKATLEFMRNSQIMSDMHARDHDRKPITKGQVVFSFPLTTEIAKAYGIVTNISGWLVAVKPDDPEILEKYRNGEYTGFSIGGKYIEVEEVST